MAAASTPLGSSSILGVTHPLYATWRPVWTRLLDVYDGAGGFLDETKPYLIPHPREWLDHSIPRTEDGVVVGYDVNPSPSRPSPKLLERRRLARYENVAATLLDQLAGALFRQRPQRVFADAAETGTAARPIEAFWSDCDGAGTKWDDALAEAWRPAAAFGHVWAYVDVHPEDARRAVVRWYTPLDVPDWLVDDQGRLVAVRFLEAIPRESFRAAPAATAQQVRVREVTAEGWRLTRLNGKVLAEGTHDFGVLPVAPFYARRRTLTPYIGRSVLGDPQLYLDLYNLVSECRELLRKQTFSIVNVPVGETVGGVDAVQRMIGAQSGTGNLLFTPNPAQMLSADSANVEAYHAHIDRLVRLIYRLAVVAWEGDSKDAESADSRRIKRDDLNQQLAAYADECQRLDTWVTDLVYRAAYGEAAPRWVARDGLTIRWPATFDVTPLEELTQQFADALALDLGDTAARELKKRAARAVLPDASAAVRGAVDADIDAAPSAGEAAGQADAARLARLTEALRG